MTTSPDNSKLNTENGADTSSSEVNIASNDSSASDNVAAESAKSDSSAKASSSNTETTTAETASPQAPATATEQAAAAATASDSVSSPASSDSSSSDTTKQDEAGEAATSEAKSEEAKAKSEEVKTADANASAGADTAAVAEGAGASENSTDGAAGAAAKEGAASGEVGADKTQYKMGDDVSAITGRPHMTAEENAALRDGARFFNKAMESSARARGEEYHPYRIPANMRAALAKIDAESATERANELKEKAEKEGRELTKEELELLEQEVKFAERRHSIDPEELEELKKKKAEEERINAGGARFIHKYNELIQKQKEYREESKMKMARNMKILGIVGIGLVGYLAYNEFLVDRDAQTIEELKAQLPIQIDSTTSMVRIDDRNNNFKIFFEKDPAAFAGVSAEQKEAALDSFNKHAPLLCKNPLLKSIINSGKQVTVLLEATDRSFFREAVIDKCPTSGLSAKSEAPVTSSDVPSLNHAAADTLAPAVSHENAVSSDAKAADGKDNTPPAADSNVNESSTATLDAKKSEASENIAGATSTEDSATTK